MAAFGENFTTSGLAEDAVHLGDRFSLGSAEVVVTQPRLPCYKLGIRFQSDQMVKRFLASGRTGFYVSVSREGDVGAGDDISLVSRDTNAVPVSEITRLYVLEGVLPRSPGAVEALSATTLSWRMPPSRPHGQGFGSSRTDPRRRTDLRSSREGTSGDSTCTAEWPCPRGRS